MASSPLTDLAAAISAGGAVILTGAGISTDSGIPDYRSPGRPVRTPMQHADFIAHPAARARYWLRSAVGWPRFAQARPNAAHVALARLQQRGCVTRLVTQNVDGLHQRAGAVDVCELHGSLHEVTCLGCGASIARAVMQQDLVEANPWLAGLAGAALADGDVELAAELEGRLRVPACARCGGVLKPAVVFFGGNVAPALVAASRAAIERAAVLLVIGSSLTVFSGYRFALYARAHRVPIAIVNRGPTRADALATWRFEDGAREVTAALAEAIA